MTHIVAVDYEAGKALFQVRSVAVVIDINKLDVERVVGMRRGLVASAWMKVAPDFAYPSVWQELAEAAVTTLEVEEKPAATTERKFRVPQAVKDEAQQALDWVHGFGRGDSNIGMGIAKLLVSEYYVPLSTVNRISRYFARRGPAVTEAAGWSAGEQGYPADERIRYSLWGGSPAREWSGKIASKHVLTDSNEPVVASAGAFEHDPNCDYFAHGVDPNTTLSDGLYKLDESGNWQERANAEWHDIEPPADNDVVIMLDPESAKTLADVIDNQAPEDPSILPYELKSINPHESALVADALPELDFALIDRVFDIYDSQERSVNAKKQERAAGGKFGETGAEARHQEGQPKARLQAALPIVPDIKGRIDQYLQEVAQQRGQQAPAQPQAPTPAAPGAPAAPAPAAPAPTPVAQYNARIAEFADAPVSDVRPLYLAIVDGVDTEAVLDVIALVPPAQGQQADVTCWKRNAGAWVPAAEILQQLRSVQPPPVVELTDDALLAGVLQQVDEATKDSGGTDSPQKEPAPQGQTPVNNDGTSTAPKPDANPDQHPVPQAASTYALPDGTFTIRTVAELSSALESFADAKNPDLTREHIVKRARALNRRDLLPKEWRTLAVQGAEMWGPYGEIMDLAQGGLDKNRGGADKLRHYWVDGEGGAKIGWGTPGDWSRCVTHLSKYLGVRAKGYCTLRHHDATGFWPGHAPTEQEPKPH